MRHLIITILLLPLFSFSQDSIFVSSDKWGTSDTDDVPVEVGTQVKLSEQGLITHIKYNSPIAGTFIYRIWSKRGVKLYEQPFNAATGWNRIPLTTPYLASADTFVVSVYATRAYGSRTNYFTSPKVKGSITAINSRYTAGGGFPTSNYRQSSYYVDFIFETRISISAGKDDTATLSLDTCGSKPFVDYTLQGSGPDGLIYEWTEAGDSSFVKTGKSITVRYNEQGAHLYFLTAKDQAGREISKSDVIVTVLGNAHDVVGEVLRNGTFRTKGDAILITTPFEIQR